MKTYYATILGRKIDTQELMYNIKKLNVIDSTNSEYSHSGSGSNEDLAITNNSYVHPTISWNKFYDLTKVFLHDRQVSYYLYVGFKNATYFNINSCLKIFTLFWSLYNS